MEEKERYEYYLGTNSIKDNKTNQIYDYIVDLLNQQDKRIKELEEENGYVLFEDGYDKDGNEIHKQVYTTYKEEFTRLVLENKKLRKENQQLKQTQKQLAIEELKLALDNFRNRPAYFDVARQELCLSEQDKQFIDFINNRIKELGGEKNE